MRDPRPMARPVDPVRVRSRSHGADWSPLAEVPPSARRELAEWALFVLLVLFVLVGLPLLLDAAG